MRARRRASAPTTPTAPAAMAMRADARRNRRRRPKATSPRCVTVPLRGCRRAPRRASSSRACGSRPGGELDLLDRADELGRQLSSAVENMQLLDDVMRSRRELENTFDSISHLVAVSDTRGHIVHVNQAFATRVGRPREELLDRPLADHLGPELAAVARAAQVVDARHARRRPRAHTRGRRSGAEGAVHGDGHRPARTRIASRSAASSSRAT